MKRSAHDATLSQRIATQISATGRRGMSAFKLAETLGEPRENVDAAIRDLRTAGRIVTVAGERSAKWMLVKYAGEQRRKRVQMERGPTWVPPIEFFPPEIRDALTRARAATQARPGRYAA